jgi:TRAP-type mannitol/chloroaromatic compound transport system permease large subunit
MSVAILFGMIIALLLIGVPIAVALGLSSIVFLLVLSDTSLASIAQSFFQAMAGHYTLLAIPFLFWHPPLCQRVAWLNGSFGFPSRWSVISAGDWRSRVCLPV